MLKMRSRRPAFSVKLWGQDSGVDKRHFRAAMFLLGGGEKKMGGTFFFSLKLCLLVLTSEGQFYRRSASFWWWNHFFLSFFSAKAQFVASSEPVVMTACVFGSNGKLNPFFTTTLVIDKMGV